MQGTFQNPKVCLGKMMDEMAHIADSFRVWAGRGLTST